MLFSDFDFFHVIHLRKSAACVRVRDAERDRMAVTQLRNNILGR